MAMKTIRENIHRIRLEKGLTQEQLAQKAGLSTGFIGAVERGNRSLSVASFIKIAYALEVKPSELAATEKERNNT